MRKPSLAREIKFWPRDEQRGGNKKKKRGAKQMRARMHRGERREGFLAGACVSRGRESARTIADCSGRGWFCPCPQKSTLGGRRISKTFAAPSCIGRRRRAGMARGQLVHLVERQSADLATGVLEDVVFYRAATVGFPSAMFVFPRAAGFSSIGFRCGK